MSPADVATWTRLLEAARALRQEWRELAARVDRIERRVELERDRLRVLIPPVVGLLLVVGACDGGPIAVEGARPVHDVPAAAREAYAAAEACSGLEGDVDAVRWFETVAITNRHEDRTHAAAWIHPHDIHLVPDLWRMLRAPEGSAESRTARDVVQHEALHDLLQRGGHPERWSSCAVGWP